ncbi:hypothetical protein FRUB_07586 [Fimbriiglobus ruber]|uniref:Uncharacterized protein n=1 Tax=Fimbriiglobus ruber TaxID=1908690 RepID=A0A225DLW2_9BACT|nr:hypothetical protein FRUB_07586 [Fimbriiglobus ruber]
MWGGVAEQAKPAISSDFRLARLTKIRVIDGVHIRAGLLKNAL